MTAVLNEAVMGLLALVALATAVGPLVFDVSPGLDRWLTFVEWVVLAVFVLEFCCQLALARDRGAWLRSPWRIVDAIAILGPLLSFLSDAFKGTLALRFLRIGRAVAFGTRAGVVAARRRRVGATILRSDREVLTVVRPSSMEGIQSERWDAVVAAAGRQETFWCHVSSPTAPFFEDLGRVLGLPAHELSTIFGPEGRSRRKLSDVTVVSVAIPDAATMAAVPEERCRLLLVVTGRWLITATSTQLDIVELVGQISADESAGDVPFSLMAATRVLEVVADKYSQVAHRCEDELYRVEEMRAGGGEQFLNRAFQLQRQISAAAGEIWRMKGLVRSPGESTDSLRSALAASSHWLALTDDFEGLSGRFADLKDEVKALIELHMNVTSFEMNKFMKLLAIIGFLGLIPSVIGGLLGMNVIDNPWPVTLGQVAFGIAMGMALSLYVFAVKGWLR